MQNKLILFLTTSFLFSHLTYAQSSIQISDGKYSKKECDIPASRWKVELQNSLVYLNSEKGLPKGSYNVFVQDNETCMEKKVKAVSLVMPYSYEVVFVTSPKKKMALMVEKDANYVSKGFHAIDGEGNVLWTQNWDLKSGDMNLTVMNTDVDDEGNASFFVKGEQKKQGNAYAFVYRNVSDGSFKVIGYSLDVNGRVTFRNKFDQWGNIHFMGAFERTDTRETGEVKRGIFHGKVNPKEEDKLVTTLYPFQETKKYDSEWKLDDYIVDDNGNITLCGLGHYKKGGAGRDFTKIFIIQLDDNGKEKWSHLITTINLMKDMILGGGRFKKLGDNYAFLYFDNSDYLQYTSGIDQENLSSEPKQNDLQMYLIDAEGKLTKHSIAPLSLLGKYGNYSTDETENALYIRGEKVSKKISW